MSRDAFTVSRGGTGPRAARATPSLSRRTDDQPSRVHPLSVLAIASSTRLDDPRRERERLVLVEVAILAAREMASALERWLSETLAEYRGSHSAWDLEATTAELHVKLDRYEQTFRETADRLVALIPGLVDGIPGLSPAADLNHRGRLLDEIAATSGLLTVIEPRASSQAGTVGDTAG
jgi:hypothetical protein